MWARLTLPLIINSLSLDHQYGYGEINYSCEWKFAAFDIGHFL